MCSELSSVQRWFTLQEEPSCIGERTLILICSMSSKEAKEAKNQMKNDTESSDSLLVFVFEM